MEYLNIPEMTPDRNNSLLPARGAEENQTFWEEPPGSEYYHMFKLIETYFLPLTCVVGLICNGLATKTFLHKKMRKFSCSMYLVTKSVSDSVFLLNLLVIYICGAFALSITTVRILCKIIIFVTYVSGFVSVWSVILVTVENFIRIRLPYDVKRFCTTRNASIAICTVITISLCMYHFSLWITDEDCRALPQYTEVTKAFVIIDTLLTLILPSILLTTFIIAIISKLLSLHHIRNKDPTGSQAAIPLTPNIRKSGQNRKSDSQIAAVTRMLLAVSLTFFVLSGPSHVVRLVFLISSFVMGQKQISRTGGAVQGIAQLFFYLSLAVNLFIFLLFGENFRRVFKKIYSRAESSDSPVSESEKEIFNYTCAESTEHTRLKTTANH